MHERTMRAMARWLFVACCAVPTAGTMLAILTTWTPWYHGRCLRAMEAGLALRTGLTIRIGDFERFTPTSWRLSEVAVSDPETDRLIGEVRKLWWVRDGDNTVIRMSQPELQASATDQLWDLIHQRFLCRPEQTKTPVRFAADDLTIHSGTGSRTLRDVDGYLRQSDQQVTAMFRCVPAEEPPAADGIVIEVVRDRDAPSPRTRWSLQTGDIRLPISLFSNRWPMLDHLGSEATFHGTVSARQVYAGRAGSWRIDLSGLRLESIQLATLTEHWPHRISGTAALTFYRCQLHPDGEVDIAGELRAKDGWMSAGMLPRLAGELGWQCDQSFQQDFAYDLFAARFDLFGSQLKIDGICSTEPGFEPLPAGTVVSSARQPVVRSHQRVMPATQLARIVAPPHSVSVPLSGQTAGLLAILRPPRGPLPGVGGAIAADTSRSIGDGHSETLDRQPHESDGDPWNQTRPAARIGQLTPWSDQRSAIAQPR